MNRLAFTSATLLSVIAIASPASAAVTPVTYFFYALVTQSGKSDIPPGTVVPISVTVDTSFPAFTQQNHVTTYRGGAGSDRPAPILAATANGVDVSGLGRSVTITQNLEGVYEIEILTFTPQGGGALDLVLKTSMKGVVKSDKIPKQVFPGNFQSATVSVSYGFTGYSGQIVD